MSSVSTETPELLPVSCLLHRVNLFRDSTGKLEQCSGICYQICWLICMCMIVSTCALVHATDAALHVYRTGLLSDACEAATLPSSEALSGGRRR